MSLCFETLKEVCKWSYIYLFQTLLLKLQLTPNFQEWWYVWCRLCRGEQNVSCRETCFCAIQCNIWHFNCFKLEFCATLRCFVAQLFVENLPENVWSLADSVGITMNFFICLAIVNLFKLCILIPVFWKCSQKIPRI